MSSRLKLIVIVWVSVAVMLRIYGFAGGDASIVGGLLFLVWTAPFGLVWEFQLSHYALMLMPVLVSQMVGDIIVIVTGFLFWFVFLPWVRNFHKDKHD
jgi:hypothetical protein